MLASTWMDPVLGIDIHYEFVPTPTGPVPTPIPNPFVGVIFDPMGMGIGLVLSAIVSRVTGETLKGPVLINGLPANTTGTEATATLGLPHIIIPPGTSWAPFPKTPAPTIRPGDTPEPPNPVMPDNDAVMITGSKTVHISGTNACRIGDLAMSCSEPVRLPSSAVLAIPKGKPVLIGGPPALDLMAAAFAAIRTRFVSDTLNAWLSRILRQGRLRRLLSRAVCFLTGHPVDVATGRMLTSRVDFELPGPLPLKFERFYDSACSSRALSLGYGWSHSLDQAVWRERGRVVYRAEDGREIVFDTFDLPGHAIRPGEELFHPIDRLTLKCLPGDRWEVWTPEGVCHELAPIVGGDPLIAKLRCKRTRDNHRIELHYDADARLIAVRDSAGRRILFENDAHGRVLAVKLPMSREDGHFVHTRYGYDAHGDLVAVADPLGHAWSFEYAGHLMTRETDRAGLSFYFGYDGIGEEAWCVRTWGDGGIYDHVIDYDKKGKVTFVTNSLGETTIYRMNALGQVTAVVDPHGNAAKYEYDPRTFRESAIVDRLGNAVRYAYDERGNIVRTEQPDGAVARYEHDPRFLDSPVRAIDVNGNEWTWEYDAFGRVTAERDARGLVTRYEYRDGLLERMTEPGGRTTEIGFTEDRGGVGWVRNPRGAELRIERDRLGRIVKLVGPDGSVQRRSYDAAGNLVRVEEPDGIVREREHDREQNLTRVRDRFRDITLGYTGYYQLHERSENGGTVRLHYDTEDRLASVENEAGEHYRFERDARGFIVGEIAFDGSAKRYVCDAEGNVTKVRHANRATADLCYDKVGRMTDVRYSDGRFERYRYRADGQLLEATNQSAEVHMERDPVGQLLQELTRLPDGTESWVRSGYGPDGLRIRVEDSDGHMQHVHRNLVGDVDRMEIGRGVSPWTIELEHDALGREIARAFPNGIRSEWVCDAGGRPLARTVSGGGTLNVKRYEWERDDAIGAVLDEQFGSAFFRHDARGRLVRAHLPSGEEQHRAMDAIGNVFRSPDRRDRRYGSGGRLLEAEGTSYHHDADGRIDAKTDVLGETTRYRWAASGALDAVELPDGRVVRFEYDAFGRRLSKSVSAEEDGARRLLRETRWRWDANIPRAEKDSERGESVWVYEPDTFNPLAKMSGGRIWGVLVDHLGTPTELVDEGGGIAWQGEVDIYGHMRASGTTSCALRWPGLFEDEETGLQYNRFRYYDPDDGLYISPDPLGVLGSLHQYAYPDDPLLEIDPFGLVPIPLNAPGYHVYGLYHPGESRPYYVGITDDLPRRERQHFDQGRMRGSDIMDPIVEDVTYAEARGAEQFYIERFGTRTGRRPGNVINSFRLSRTDKRGLAFRRHYRRYRRENGCTR